MLADAACHKDVRVTSAARVAFLVVVNEVRSHVNVRDSREEILQSLAKMDLGMSMEIGIAHGSAIRVRIKGIGDGAGKRSFGGPRCHDRSSARATEAAAPSVVILALSQDDVNLTWAVHAGDQAQFDVARFAGAGDEREARGWCRFAGRRDGGEEVEQ